MTKKKSKGSLGKVVAGATLAAAAAGAAVVLSNKKTRKQIATKAKKAVSDIKTDPKAKKLGSDTADFLGRLGEMIKNFFK